MKWPMFELIVFPACLNCRWRELEESEAWTGDGTRYITECKKAPVCKLIEGQEKFHVERGQ